MRKYVLLAVLMSLMVYGCKRKDQPEPPLTAAKVLPATDTYPNNSPRFKVERVAVVYDELAFGHARGVYTITDTKTGKEFFGVSGVGISEVGGHRVSVGKQHEIRHDER